MAHKNYLQDFTTYVNSKIGDFIPTSNNEQVSEISKIMNNSETQLDSFTENIKERAKIILNEASQDDQVDLVKLEKELSVETDHQIEELKKNFKK